MYVYYTAYYTICCFSLTLSKTSLWTPGDHKMYFTLTTYICSLILSLMSVKLQRLSVVFKWMNSCLSWRPPKINSPLLIHEIIQHTLLSISIMPEFYNGQQKHLFSAQKYLSFLKESYPKCHGKTLFGCLE